MSVSDQGVNYTEDESDLSIMPKQTQSLDPEQMKRVFKKVR